MCREEARRWVGGVTARGEAPLAGEAVAELAEEGTVDEFTPEVEEKVEVGKVGKVVEVEARQR